MAGLRGIWSLALALALQGADRAGAAEALAFVTDAKAGAQVVRRAGLAEAAVAGAQLFAGDTLAAGQGSAVLIYLSGRTVEVPAGGRHPVGGEAAQATALMGRVMETLAEVAGPGSEAQGPVVHGMARAFGAISGAMPANTRVSRTDFTFCWDPVEEVEGYAFALEDTAGKVLARKVVKGTSLSSAQVGVQPGRSYVWSVSSAGGALSADSGKLWVQVASAADSLALHQGLAGLGGEAGKGSPVLAAMALYGQGFCFEAAETLAARKQQGPLTQLEESLLQAARQGKARPR